MRYPDLESLELALLE